MVRMRALHLVARAALRVLPPRRAKAVVDEAARVMPRFASLEEARRAADALDATGTCLSRAMVLSARLDGAAIVIAVDASPNPSGNPARDPLLDAHAWVEIDGAPLRESDPRGQEIVRL